MASEGLGLVLGLYDRVGCIVGFKAYSWAVVGFRI